MIDIDIFLELTRAIVLAILFVWLLRYGKRYPIGAEYSWNTILTGFGLLLFGSVLDITDNFPSLNHLVVVGDTEVEAILEKFVGFLGGFIFLSIGLIRWLPSIKEAEQKLERSKQAAIKASAAKDEFLASMSHELRTPLTSIIGNSELLLEGGECSGSHCPKQDVDQILKMIYRAGTNQLALVNDILDMSKIESGKFTIDETPYDLTKSLAELQSIFAVQAADQGITFVLDQKNREPYLLCGDGQRIRQILINLIGNAIKFTEQGEVRLTAWVDQGKLIFQVKDSGIGMSREMVDELFQRFHQADSSISRRFGGSGLGLYISENLANLMGGEIDVSSEAGVGSIFTVRVPYQVTDTQVSSHEQKNIEHSTGLGVEFSGHILIAEDTLELQMLERRILETIGLTVTVANNGQEAIDRINQQHFDLVFMDMQMPQVDGIEATRTLREQGHTLPIVALTANVMQKHREAFNAAGCDGFLGKPIDKLELRRVLSKYLLLEQDRVQLSQLGVADRREVSRRNEEIAVIDDDRSAPRRLQDRVNMAFQQSIQPEEEVDYELMAIFVHAMEERKERLIAALQVKDLTEVRTIAHEIKGSAVSFGYPELSQQAEQLQLAFDEERMDEMGELALDLLAEIEKELS